jgi:hypothetical protein
MSTHLDDLDEMVKLVTFAVVASSLNLVRVVVHSDNGRTRKPRNLPRRASDTAPKVLVSGKKQTLSAMVVTPKKEVEKERGSSKSREE